jgi:hypothetical protein
MAVGTDLVWIRTTRKVRARLNAWRMLAGVTGSGELDQTATIDNLLNAVGAPDVPNAQTTPDAAAVRND